MNLLTVLYVILVIAGVAWVLYRLRTYMSQERDRESRWAEMASEEEFRSYLKDVREKTSTTTQGTKEKSRGENPPSPVPRPVKREKDRGARHQH